MVQLFGKYSCIIDIRVIIGYNLLRELMLFDAESLAIYGVKTLDEIF